MTRWAASAAVADALGVCLLAACLAASPLVAVAFAQPRADRDKPAVERALAAATGAARIPLLIELSALHRGEGDAILPLTREALDLLASHPSAPLEAAARVLRSHGLEGKADYPAALEEARRAEGLAAGLNDDLLRADAAYQVGYVEWRMSNNAVAREKAEMARRLQAPRGNSTALARTLNLIGAIHYSESALDAALESYLAALRMSEATGDEQSAARSHNNIGLVYWDLGRNKEALAALTRALEIHERRGPKANLVNTLNNVGLVLCELDRTREGIPYLERALKMDREAGDLYGQAKALSNLGGAAEQLGEWDRSADYHERALAIRKQIGDKEGIARSSVSLGLIWIRQGHAKDAIPVFQQAADLAASINDLRDQADAFTALSTAHETGGDHAAALAAYRRYHELQARLNAGESQRYVAEMEARYQSREREREISALASLASSRRETLQWFMAGSVLLGGCLILLGFSYVHRLRVQRALAESEQRYRALFQNSVVPTFLVETDTRRVIDLNGPARALCGDVTGAEAVAIEPEWARRALTRSFESGSAEVIAFDDRWTDSLGALRWTEIRGSSVAVGRRACRLVALRDATELYAREEARQQEDRLRSLGVLAGGIAHDFNNALMSITGYVELAKSADPVQRLEMLELAERAATTATGLTTQLLSFARGGEPRRRITDVGRLLRDAVALAGAGSHMRITVDTPDDLWHANLDDGQFRQVVSNLVINAEQATTEGGMLRVTARNVVDPLSVGPTPGDQRFVRIDFEDNGAGIPEEISRHVFDPYFTTKPEGSGLGLTTAFAVCRNHGGRLTFESSDGRGTTFSAFFPASEETAAAVEPESAADPQRHGRVLVLDDEPMVRDILARMLTTWGFSVEAVADGQRAVERYVEELRKGAPFDLLIMDLTIPGGMGGLKATAEIHAHDPDALAIVASGYSDDPTMANYREAGFAAALAKPFNRTELAQVLNAVLKGSRARSADGHRGHA
jgi:signal transduction histidine kinase/ActR/RegA family two-component response regulator